MSTDPREQALQNAHEILSEQFPHVVIVAEAQFIPEGGETTSTAQLMRWYGDSTTATGLTIYASDFLGRRFGEPKPPSAQAGVPAMPLKAPQEDAIAKSLQILGEQFSCIVVVAQSEGEFSGNVERSVKVLRCAGNATTAAGLVTFACNALRKMAFD